MVQRATLRKLELIHAAKDVEDLRVPPCNRLERLVGDRREQHSIRVNAQMCPLHITRSTTPTGPPSQRRVVVYARFARQVIPRRTVAHLRFICWLLYLLTTLTYNRTH